MANKYENKEGVHIDVHTDKNGKDHVSFYDKNPKDPSHSSIHVNWDSKTGKGTIIDNTSGSKESTDVSCYLTSACMKHYLGNFKDNCYELTVLRWFRDNYVSKEDIDHYYRIAPIIVKAIEQEEKKDIIYDYIYDNVVDACVTAIENGDYKFAYDRYKSSILSFEETFAKPELQRNLVYSLQKKIKNI